jgi:hypothetical protein
MRSFLFALAALAVASLLPAQEPNTDRLSELQRDLSLIETLVKEGIRLAEQDDPIHRARTCNVLVEKLVDEIQDAAGKKDRRRTTILGNYLEDVLVRGMASNLSQARKTPGNQPELERLSRQVLRATQPVADLNNVQTGRTAVKNALREKTQ